MIASENLMSPLAKEMMISDFHDRYAEGLPGKRYYRGNIYVDKVELKCIELAQRIFRCKFADVRPISGTVANMAALFALTQPGETITCTSLDHGAHISTAKFGAVGFRGVSTVTYPFNTKDMVIDVEGARKLLLEQRPKVANFGLSVFLFPAPLKELQEDIRKVRKRVTQNGVAIELPRSGGRHCDYAFAAALCLAQPVGEPEPDAAPLPQGWEAWELEEADRMARRLRGGDDDTEETELDPWDR